jgi:predicted unusual protein kinase regulating ubiquinone biosynthesis (AarF/ABC1/UbiB family)
LAPFREQAPAHGFGWTRQLVERSFGASFESLFASFDETPFASGSIGQVTVGG